ncbi:MAG: hypothetical protein S4CHLAM45_01990 [Chlamydiales bacterium]|nr:hypothetical protein [Chlamydiales bacterium]MCH9620336.1 hypothetical protein [Chlamydiales bacterium]MCH9622322.1 hypothetical protein [Chlamydiales bacterium]
MSSLINFLLTNQTRNVIATTIQEASADQRIHKIAVGSSFLLGGLVATAQSSIHSKIISCLRREKQEPVSYADAAVGLSSVCVGAMLIINGLNEFFPEEVLPTDNHQEEPLPQHPCNSFWPVGCHSETLL